MNQSVMQTHSLEFCQQNWPQANLLTLQNSRILAIESCTPICSAALLYQGNLTEIILHTPRAHSTQLLPIIQQLLSNAGVRLTDLDYLACSHGPGAFTGIRIGVGVTKGLALGSGLPIIPITSTQALAYQALSELASTTKQQSIVAMLDARMQAIYVARYHQDLSIINAPELIDPRAWQPLPNDCLLGSGVEIWQSHQAAATNLQPIIMLPHCLHPSAAAVALLASQQTAHALCAKTLQALYLRDKVTD